MESVELPPVYTRALAVAAGLTRAELRDDGVRVSRGAYVSRAVALDLRAACLAVVSVLPAGSAFSHLTAAALLGAPVANRVPLSVTVPRGTYRPRRTGLRTHVRSLDEGDVVEHAGLALTSGSQTWLDLAGVLPEGELVAGGMRCSVTATSIRAACGSASSARRVPAGSSSRAVSRHCSLHWPHRDRRASSATP